MTIIDWKDHFRIGLELIDDQHKLIFEMLGELHQTLVIDQKGRSPKALQAFQQLIDYICFHFDDEILNMEKEGIDSRFLAHHQRTHEKFVDQVYALWSRRADLRDSANAFVGFIGSWLGMHILGVDKSMARQCLKIRQGIPSAQAYEEELHPDNANEVAMMSMMDGLYQTLSDQNVELVHANTSLEGQVALASHELNRAQEELRQAHLRLEAFSRTDGLLQISNRGYFDDRMRIECADAYRRKTDISLIMIDLDYFKRYNDHYGHLEGDKCLKRISQAIRKALMRTTDLIARYGGDEIGVILPDTDARGALIVAERIQKEVAMLAIPHARSSINRHVTLSMGIVSAVPPERDAPDNLVNSAILSLDQAKSAGRNRWCAT